MLARYRTGFQVVVAVGSLLAGACLSGCSDDSSASDGTGGAGGAAGAAGMSAGGTGGMASANAGCLAPVGATNVIISEIRVGEAIELFNPTDAAVDISGYFLCSPVVYDEFAERGLTTIEPGQYLNLSWFADDMDTAAGGMAILYKDGMFFDAASMLDIVCWGAPTAEQVMRKDTQGAPWTGDCAPALMAGAIHRVPGTTGQDAASYNTVAGPSPMACP